MNAVAQGAALVSAAGYLAAAPVEMVLFERPAARALLHVQAQNVEDVRMWAFVVGFRNLLAGLAAMTGLVMLHSGEPDSGAVVVVVAVVYMLLASLAMGLADALGYWRPRGGSVVGTLASSVPPAVALVASAL